MENKIKISFWLYKAKKNQKNLVPIYLRVWNNYDYFTRSTGLFAKQADWEKKTQRIKGTTPDAASINSQLEGLRHKVIDIINQLTIKGKPFDIELVKKYLEGDHQQQMTLMKAYTDHLKMMNRMLGKEYTKSTIIKYNNTKLRLTQYLKFKFKRKDIFLYELNYDFMKGFEIFLRERFDNSTTTCYKHWQRFTRILNLARQKGYMDLHPFPEYKIRQPKKKIEYLTQEEVDRIKDTDYKIKRLNTIRDIFVFCIYSGLAYAEVEKLSVDDLTIGGDGKPWMNILRKKTNKPYQVPVLPVPAEIIEKYKNHPLCIKKNRLLPVPSNVKYNAYLKEIAAIAGIKQHLTTHLARKTFATTIMLTNGVNIGVLSRLLGHASVQVTLDSYGAFNDQLMMSQVSMIREKLVAKDERFEIYEMKDNSASKDLVTKFKNSGEMN